MNSILLGAPWLIAHRSMLGVNQPYKITINGQDFVLWQNKNGKIFALDDVCPHMQAPLSTLDHYPSRFHSISFQERVGR